LADPGAASVGGLNTRFIRGTGSGSLTGPVEAHPTVTASMQVEATNASEFFIVLRVSIHR
jgi:hypothetical protein